MRVFDKRPGRSFSRWMVVILAAAVLALVPVPAHAAAEAHGGGHALPSFGQFLQHLIPYWVNFLIYSAVIFSLVRKPLVNGWAQRRKSLAEQVERAGEALRSAQDLLAEAESRLRSFRRSAESLRQEIQKEGEVETARIIEQAELRARRLVEQARDSAEAERKSAYRIFRAGLAEKAAGLTRARLTSDTTEEADRLYRSRACEDTKELLQ